MNTIIKLTEIDSCRKFKQSLLNLVIHNFLAIGSLGVKIHFQTGIQISFARN